MKTLILMRHAKSSWDNPSEDDFDRSLNARGKEDAPEMGRRLKARGIKVDAFVSSPARRARSTARRVAAAFGVGKEEIIFLEALYHAAPADLYKQVSGLKNTWDTVVLVGHNNGITEFASSLTGVHIDNMPTASQFGVAAETSDWSGFGAAPKHFLFFDYPKNPLP